MAIFQRARNTELVDDSGPIYLELLRIGARFFCRGAIRGNNWFRLRYLLICCISGGFAVFNRPGGRGSWANGGVSRSLPRRAIFTGRQLFFDTHVFSPYSLFSWD